MNTRKRLTRGTTWLAFIILLCLCAGCRQERGESTEPTPPPLIGADSLVKVLVDVHLIEASLKIKYTKKQDNEQYSRIYYDRLFEKHGITREQFDQSIRYYEGYADSLDMIYEKVIVELTKIQNQIK